MRASLRLIRIETRRNPGLFLVIPLAALVWWMAISPLPDMVTLWPRVSATVRDTAQALGPLAGGLAAWMAGKARRSQTEELLGTTPRQAVVRDLTAWGATVVWAVMAFAVGASVAIVQASMKATWGAPLASPIAIAFLFVAVSTALGYAVGTWVRSRFTAPLTAIVLAVTLSIPDMYPNSIRYLSVFSVPYRNVFSRVHSDITWLHVWWLLGLFALAVGAIVLKRNRNALSGGLVMTGAVASLVPAVLLVRATDRTESVPVPYEPLCAEAGIEVCIHPAYETMQPETLGVISMITAPLVGILGAPTRAEQVPLVQRWELSPDGVIPFELSNVVVNGYGYLRSQIATSLVYDEQGGTSEAQQVVRAWLLHQVGVPVCPQIGGHPGCTSVGNLLPEVERFLALEPEVRDAWLHDNYIALRAGELTLEDLP